MSLDAPSQRLLRSSPVLPQQVSVADFVYSEILGAVHDGRLRPGERLNDIELADQFGVSRTPVREALQRLREIGLVEAAAARYTRVSLVDSRRTRQAVIVWVALLRTVVDEVVPVGDPDRDRRLAEIQASAADPGDSPAVGGGTPPTGPNAADRAVSRLFRVLDVLTASSANPVLRRTLSSVDHVVRLGLAALPAPNDQPMGDFVVAVTDELLDAFLEPSVSQSLDALARLADVTQGPDTFVG
ncbi:GntR family transcriptional regulator [Nakamurella flava]|uniref:GntR family transcriptional regulator n=1 Tax=Nakamurella flava TaxID=2576308 RepID=A0A4U6QEW7_9ACTN|nr:GntR family transcriptional regulator [Nakamurella flava]TKV58611.1 GntR family transcriptional regulator [Nakamurella flava]